MSNPTEAALAASIDALLPQTQCGLCLFTGCKPYAEALAAKEAPIDACLPGGVPTLKAIAETLSLDPSSFIEGMKEKEKLPAIALIQEEACIGCTKCIQACPTDAIIGASKKMHSIIAADCTGCELCIPPCPMDCIEIIPLQRTEHEKGLKSSAWRKLYNLRTDRLERKKKEDQKSAPKLSKTTQSRQEAIALALKRAQKKRETRG